MLYNLTINMFMRLLLTLIQFFFYVNKHLVRTYKGLINY